jgi:ABC-2 type transport system permease protein
LIFDMTKSPTLSIAKKEFTGFLNQPTGYILTIPFIIISYFLYFRTALLAGEATLRPFFNLLPWFLLILGPAVTMKSLAEESRLGTMETLLSNPINEIQIVVGKFLGNFAFLTLALLLTLSLPISLTFFSQPDPGIFASQYISAVFLAAAFTATGIAASSLTKHQVSAFLAALGINFLLLLSGLEIVYISLPSPLNFVAIQLGVLTHTQSLARGLIDLRDISYFLTLTTVFLAIAVIKLLQRKTVEHPRLQTQTYIGLALIILIGLAANYLLQSLPARIDLTHNHQFTLSSATKNYLGQLPDLVTVKLFTSQSLPAPMQLVNRDTQDLLKDYQRFAKGNLQVVVIHPDTDPQVASQAQSLGIAQVQFNTMGNSKFEVEQGYLGLAVQYANQTETIPFLQNTDNLEYRLTRLIAKLTGNTQKQIAFFSGSQALTSSDLSGLTTQLQTQYQTTLSSLDSPDTPPNFDLLIVAGPQQPLSATASATINQFLENGGKALILADGVQVNPQFQTATAANLSLDSLLSPYGLQLQSDLVYDLELNNTVRLTNQYQMYFLPYPFWPRVIPNQDFTPLADIPSVSLAWPSSVNFTDNDQLSGTPLLTTSDQGGHQTDNLSIAPDQQLTPQGAQTLAYAVENQTNHSRLVLVGNSNFATDQMAQSHPENISFISNSVDWLIGDPALAGIPSRPQQVTLLQFSDPTQTLLFHYGNLLGIPLLVGAYGAYRLYQRRRYTQG